MYLSGDERYQIVAEAEDGQDCLDQLENVEADLILTDFSMPIMTGLELAIHVKKDYPQLKLVALTMMSEREHILEMVSNGAKGYLLKNCGEDELKKAIHDVMNGGSFFSPEVEEVLKKQANRESQAPVEKEREPLVFTRKEKEVLALIKEGCTTEDIEERLHFSPRTLEALIRNLLYKTGARDISEL